MATSTSRKRRRLDQLLWMKKKKYQQSFIVFVKNQTDVYKNEK